MNLSGNKFRQLWLPFLVLAVLILATSWMLAGVIYPNNLQENPVDSPTNPVSFLTTATFTDSVTHPTVTRSLTSGASTPASFPTTTRNCTYSTHYWRANPNAWMIENVVIGRLVFSKDEAIDILDRQPEDEVTALLQQFFTALLNTLKGANADAVETALIQTSDWLSAHPEGVDLSQFERNQANALTQALSEYNNGAIGPGHCADEPPTPTPLPSLTPTSTNTPTQTPLITRRPSATPTSEEGGAKPTKPPAPTDTPPPPPPPSPTKPPTATPSPPPPTPTPAPTESP